MEEFERMELETRDVVPVPCAPISDADGSGASIPHILIDKNCFGIC